MKKEFTNTIGIDFGTTNTFINRCPIDKLLSTPIIINSRETGVETAILYIKNDKPLIGNIATRTWGNSNPKDRNNYELHLRFKPEIETSDEAKKYALDFFYNVISLSKQKFGDITQQSNKILIGVPSEANDNFCNSLKKIAHDAGFNNLELIEEPIGALLFFLARNDITPTEARDGILIIDFGGGTCDFAWMQNLKVISSWGDMLLGGCLFDDLFYQWWLESNPNALKIIKKNDAEYYFHWYVCKNIKEEFSNYIYSNKNDKWSYSYREYGAFKDITWAEFISRAQNYYPSKSLIDYLKFHNVNYNKLTQYSKVNLIDWFKDLLLLEINKQKSINVKKVVLAGGSSLWLFVPEIVQEALNISQSDILKCENPYAVISQGISLYPALINIHKKAQMRLERNLDSFVKNEIRNKILEDNYKALFNKIVEHISIVLIDEKIRKIIIDFKKTGGSFNSLERNIKNELDLFQNELKNIINNDIKEHSKYISHQINNKVKEWFEDNNIKYLPSFSPTEKKFDTSFPIDLGETSPYELEEAIMVIIGTLIIANLSGGGGIALIIAGVPGLVIGGIIGLAASIYSRKKLKKILKDIEISKFFLKYLLSDSKIKQILKNIKKSFKEEIMKKLNSELNEISNKSIAVIKEIIEKEIESVSAIASL